MVTEKRTLPSLPQLKKLIGLNWDRFVAIVQGANSKSYKALITQTGTDAPTVKVLENQLGAPIVWAYSGVGVYTGTLAAAFTANKTSMKISGQTGALNRATIERTSANVVTVRTFLLSEVTNTLTATATNGLLADALVEIEVYP